MRADGELIFAHVEEFISPDRLQEREGEVKVHLGPRPFLCASTLLVRLEDFHKVGPFEIRWKLGEFVEWHARAVDGGLQPAVVPQMLARRRLHDNNMGRRDRVHRSQYAGIIKSVLDRRRGPY
jgi:hypothetical protein